jgi:hypothetical protein
MSKIGRNAPCPCGSGNKYKRCCGSPFVRREPMIPDVAIARSEAERIQRERQQGLGRPIISGELNGTRFVAVKNRLLHSKRWRTFEDFLFDYIRVVLGSEWGNAEIAKPVEERHPVVIWYQRVCAYQKDQIKEPGRVHTSQMTGVVAAYIHLAYDLYALDHNAELQSKLLARLRNRDKFSGARYEVFVAAAFIRAGFDIEFENEDDGSTTHCEFTATHRRTGKKFSVEAKRREGHRVRIGSLFNSALAKNANHTRVVFIDINTRDDATGMEEPPYMGKALRRLSSFEGQLLNGQPRPPAYVFVTNTPWDLYLDSPAPRMTGVVEGFQIPDFKGDAMASLREIINAREKHIEMHELIKSIMDHSAVPSTFDGQIPEFAFDPDMRRLLIGDRYLVPDQDGVPKPAEVTAATVNEQEKVAYCGVTFIDGRSGILKVPLSDSEMAAWRRHPDTFFGVVGQRKTHAETPLECYDFFHDAFRRESKERLLELMAGSPDFETLKALTQVELASIYAEHMTNAALASRGQAL